MADNGYLNDPKFNYNYGTVRPMSPQNQPVKSSHGSLSTTGCAVILFILSFVIFFTLVMQSNAVFSNVMWIFSMVIGIIAHLVALKGVFNARGSVTAIVVAVISAIPAYLSCCFFIVVVVAYINRAVG